MKVEARLRESEERFRLVANSAPVMIWMSGPDKLFNYFNQTWIEFTGTPLEAELGSGWADGVHPEDLKSCSEVYARAFDRREPFKMQYRHRRYDGEYRWVLNYGVPRFGPDRLFAGYIGSCIDVTERKMAEDALASLSGHLIEAQDEERRRIAREIHDDYNQRLALAANELDGIRELVEPSAFEAGQRLRELWNQLSELAADLHSLSHQLHSSTLERLGLMAGVRAFCSEFEAQQGVQVHFEHEKVPNGVPPDVALCLFRITQEALRNIKRHSGTDHAAVRLEWMAGRLHLSVSDLGKGFNSHGRSPEAGIGIRSMKERLRLVGGQLEIYSRPGKGTRIDAWVPFGVARQRAG
jgi:PAS domain S-box-containing protein